MPSTSGGRISVQARRAWRAPALVELPIGTQTKRSAAKSPSADGPANPPPGTPSTKLGFSFEMSLPLSVRTE